MTFMSFIDAIGVELYAETCDERITVAGKFSTTPEDIIDNLDGGTTF